MYMSTYGGLILVLVTISFAVPKQSSNGCGYAVRRCQDIIVFDYNDNIVDCRHAI